MTWPGGKNGAGSFQRIINHMPPHDIYIEMFLGSGAVLRNKRPAARSVAIDQSPDALRTCMDLAAGSTPECHYLEGNALELLPSLGTMLADRPFLEDPRTLIYADPPYMMGTRKGGALYDFELDDADHARLLEILTAAPCMVMISGYRSALYDEALSGFTRIDYRANTRRGMVNESLWMNFPAPVALHDYSWLGDDFRARERIKRRTSRWVDRLRAMDPQERLAVLEALKQINC